MPMLRLLLVVAVLSLTLLTVAPAGAIVGGAADDGGHPNVGALVAQFRPGGDFPACSGTLISHTVFLTAGHCIAITQSFGATGYAVTFDSSVTFDASGRVNDTVDGTATLDPLFGHDQGDFHDLAVITLKQPVSASPATLPTAGLLDTLAARGGLRGQDFTAVGYGAPGITFGGGKPEPIFDPVRRVATSSFMSLDPTRLFLLINTNATGGGGACFGDSGGPDFLGRTDVLVSLTSQKADQVCRALAVNYRLDTPSAREFLGQFVRLP